LPLLLRGAGKDVKEERGYWEEERLKLRNKGKVERRWEWTKGTSLL